MNGISQLPESLAKQPVFVASYNSLIADYKLHARQARIARIALETIAGYTTQPYVKTPKQEELEDFREASKLIDELGLGCFIENKSSGGFMYDPNLLRKPEQKPGPRGPGTPQPAAHGYSGKPLPKPAEQLHEQTDNKK